MNDKINLDDDIEIIDDVEEVAAPAVEVLFAEAPVVQPTVAPIAQPVIEPVVQPTVAPIVQPTTYADTTYTADNSLSTNANIFFGEPEVIEKTMVPDPINIFNTEEPVVQPVVTPVVVNEPAIEVTTNVDQLVNVESPDLSDELDNTLLLAKQAINPDAVVNNASISHVNGEEKSNKVGIIFIVVLFIILTAFIVALPYITDLVKNLK